MSIEVRSPTYEESVVGMMLEKLWDDLLYKASATILVDWDRGGNFIQKTHQCRGLRAGRVW